jgi:hypothetical protein
VVKAIGKKKFAKKTTFQKVLRKRIAAVEKTFDIFLLVNYNIG